MAAEHASQADAIYASLQERILSGEIPQGQRLVVRTFAMEYGASDLPVREAIRRLEGDGLAETSRHRGARVITLRPEAIPGTYLLRGQLEGLATRLAGPHLTDDDHLKLDELMEEMHAVATASDQRGYYQLNHEFHSRIFARCPYGIVSDTIRRVWDGHIAFGMVFSLDEDRIGTSIREHERILSCLRMKDWNGAEVIAREHKYGVARSLLQSLDMDIPEALQPALVE